MAKEQTSFEDILKMPSDQLERPKNVPQGLYFASVVGMPVHDRTQSGTPYSKYLFKLLKAGEDVDEDDLNAALTKEDGTVSPLREKVIGYTLWDTKDAGYRHREFLTKLGIPEESGELLEDRVAQAPGKEAWVKVKHVPAKSGGDTMYANIVDVIPVGEDD
jgi:hypothetical protein